MKRILRNTILVLIAVAGCSKVTTFIHDNQRVRYSVGAYNAIHAAELFMKEVYSDSLETKTAYPLSVDSVEPIQLPIVLSKLNAGDSIYVINYKNNDGFSIVSSDGVLSCVLAFTESGSLDCNKLFKDDSQYSCNEEKMVYRYIESMLCNYETETKPYRKHFPETKLNPGESYNVWYTDSIVHPIVHYKWGQSYPFNMYMPDAPAGVNDSTTSYRGKYAVGCVIIAAMQMAAATTHPSSITVNNYEYFLSQFNGVSMYYNYADFYNSHYDTNVSPQLKLVTQKLAYLLRWFADNIDAECNPNTGETGAYEQDAMDLLASLDNSRYSNWSTVQCPNGSLGYNPILYAMLDLHKPVIIGGYLNETRGEKSGHAWLIDGYISQHMTRPDDDEYHRHYVHFNWGWRGKYDGYFFSINNIRYQQDSLYDSNPALTTNKNLSYNIDVEFYIY